MLMKKLFTLMLMAFLAMGANATKLNLSLEDLGSGWSSSYDAATKTITYESAWTGRGWWLNGADYSAYNKVVVEFEKQDLGITLCVQYFDEGTTTINETLNSTAAVDAGVTSISVDLSQADKGRVAQVYLQSHSQGTVVLKEAYFTDEGSVNPTDGDDIDLTAANWSWGWNIETSNDANGWLVGVLTGNWGAMSTGWDTPQDWSAYGTLVCVIEEYTPAEGGSANLQILAKDANDAQIAYTSITEPISQQRVVSLPIDASLASGVKQFWFQGANTGDVIKVSRAYLVKGNGQPSEPKYADGVLWEGTALVTGWSNQPYVLSDGGTELKEAGAEAGDYLYFYASAPDENWQVQLFEGHWGPKYQVYSGMALTDENGNPVESTIVDLATQGYFSFQLTQEVLDAAFTAQGWGGSFLLNGDGNLTVTKVQLVKKGDVPSEGHVVFTWEAGVATGGTVVANGANTALSDELITVSAKKANIETDNVTITLDEALQADDVIYITGYRKKDTDANGNLYILFENGTAIDEGNAVTWNNIHENVGQQPNTNEYAVGEGAGSKVIRLARSKASTNVFITKIIIGSGISSGIQELTVVHPQSNSSAIFNLRGQQVDAQYKGIVIRNGKKYMQR